MPENELTLEVQRSIRLEGLAILHSAATPKWPELSSQVSVARTDFAFLPTDRRQGDIENNFVDTRTNPKKTSNVIRMVNGLTRNPDVEEVTADLQFPVVTSVPLF